MTLHYEFPHNVTLDEVRKIVESNPNFILGERDGYIVANYLVAGKDTHPPVVDRDTAIMREMRGLVFDPQGRLISRRFHKFFNLGEREDVSQIDVSRHHVVLEKLDGSMITPMIVNGELRWATKMGITDVAAQAEKFVKNSSINYRAFALNLLEQDCTPIFEWCSRSQRIVIDYPEDKLVLIAIRDNDTGEYTRFDRPVSEYGIPTVSTLEPISDLTKFTEELRKREDIEGVVIRFDDGHMVKVKTDTYVALHRAKSELESQRNVVRLILDEKVDDLLPLLFGDDRIALEQFAAGVRADLVEYCDYINSCLNLIRAAGMDRKSFALECTAVDPIHRSFMFKHWSDSCTLESVKDFVSKHLGSNKSFAKCDSIITAKWREIYVDD